MKKILNDIGNTYKNYIDISVEDGDSTNVNINLDEFAGVKLELKNSSRDINDNLKEYIRNLSSISCVEIMDVENGYLISLLVGQKRKERYIYFCEDINFDIELYDYSKIEISENEIIDNYRVILAVKEARNLLEKHALLGNEWLNQNEKELIKNAMLIVLLNSAQFYEVYDQNSICSIYDLFLKYDNKYEKKEFLEEALKACKLYEGKIEKIEELQNIIKYYLDIQKQLDKRVKNIESFDFSEFQKDIEKYQDKCYYYKPMYKIYSDFSVNIKNTCKDFKNKNEVDDNSFIIDINNYIKEEILPRLEENGFKGQFPKYIYKDDKKIFLVEFIIKDDRVEIKNCEQKITSKKIVSLFKNIDYRDVENMDFAVYYTTKCEDKEQLECLIEEILEEVDLHKNFTELKKEIREIMDEDDDEDINEGGFFSKIFSMLKKNK